MIPSERPGHALIENWNPLGVIGGSNLVPDFDSDMNSRHHHCLQLPRGRLRLELGPGDVLRQHNGVERSPDHPPHLHRHHQVGDLCCTSIQFPRCVADVLERNSLPGAISTLCQVLSFFSINNSIVLHSGTDMGICDGNVLHCTLPIAELIYQGIGMSMFSTKFSQAGTDVGVEMANDKRVKLVSFTGSTQVRTVLHAKCTRYVGSYLYDKGITV